MQWMGKHFRFSVLNQPGYVFMQFFFVFFCD